MKSYRSPKTEVKESDLNGKGLFAKEYIKKGELIFIKAGHIVDYGEAKKLELKLGEYCLQITDKFFLCPTTEEEVKNTAIFINHSCEPNVGPDGQISFVALRDIKVGEELFHDYAMTTDRPYELKCNCKCSNCRRIISGNDWKIKKLQDKYGENFSQFILKKIKRGL